MTFDHKVLRDTFSSGHSVSSDVLYPLLKNVGSWLLSLTFQNLPWRQFWSKHRCWWQQCASVQIEQSIWTAGCSAETTWQCQTFRIFANQAFLFSHGFLVISSTNSPKSVTSPLLVKTGGYPLSPIYNFYSTVFSWTPLMFNLHNTSHIYYVNQTYGKIFPLQSFCASWKRSPYIIFFPSRDQGQKGKHFWLHWLPHSYHIYRKYIFLHYHDF